MYTKASTTTPIMRAAAKIVPTTGINTEKFVMSAVKLSIAAAGAPLKPDCVLMLLRTRRPTAATTATMTTVKIIDGALPRDTCPRFCICMV